MSTEARDLIEQLDATAQAYLLGWIATCLDGGRPFTMEALRECVASERLTRPASQRSCTLP